MSVKQQLLSGVFYLTIAKYSSYFTNIIVLAIIARLLPPDDFGVVAIASVVMGFFNVFSDFGFASAIIQKKNLSRRDISNLFSWSFYIALLFVIAYLLLLYPLNLIYKNPLLLRINSLLVVQLLFVSLNVVPNALILKEKKFQFISIRTLIIHVICGTIAVICALVGYGIYSLVVIPILSSLLVFLVNYSYNPLSFTFRPQLSSLYKIFSYSIYNFLYNLVNYFSRNADKLIIGKVESMSNLGYYEKSYSLMLMPVQNIIAVLNPVLHPVLSDYQDNTDRMYLYFIRMTRLLAYVGSALSVFLYFASADVIHLLLGPQWDLSIPIFRMFSISVGFQILYTLQGPFFLAMNETRKMFYCGVFTAFLNVTAISVGLFWFRSLSLIALFLSISYILSFFTTFWIIVSKVFNRSFGNFISQLYNPILTTLMLIIAMRLWVWLGFEAGTFSNIVCKTLIVGLISVSCMCAAGDINFRRMFLR